MKKEYKKTYYIVKSDDKYVLLCQLDREKSIGFYQVYRGTKAECNERKKILENEN